MDENELRYLLGDPGEALFKGFPVLPWLSEFIEAFSCPPCSDLSPFLKAEPSQEMAGFLDAIAPLIRRGCRRVQEGVQALSRIYVELPFDPETIEEVLLANLPRQLLVVLSRTMILELNVARVQNLLDGDTTQERFQSFLKQVRQPDTALAILQEYPVLARQLIIHINQWVTFSLEFLRNLCADWEDIRLAFISGHRAGILVQVKALADAHRSGRAVLVAKFSSGFQLVYKPRSLAVDVHFQELLRWINNRGHHQPFRTLNILDRNSYGWVEFVAAQSCSSLAEIRRFYERQGGYIALLYLLQATDFHFENLIAVGEHPVLVDLEALFQPCIKEVSSNEADELARRTLDCSVLRVGLLPDLIWSNNDSDGIDISGLGGMAGQLTPFKVSQWEGVGTDEMRVARKRVTMPGSQNRPTLANSGVNVQDYTDAIADGFSAIYWLLLQHRDDLLSAQSPLASFTNDEVRIIFRATWTYATLLHESFHPDVLHDALDRDLLFDRLWMQVERLPYLAELIQAEREDLQQGSIPRFTTQPGSQDLWSSSNNRIAQFFCRSGMQLVRSRLEQLSEDDLRKQLWIIHASLATLPGDVPETPLRRYVSSESQTPVRRQQLLDAASAVGNRLAELALHGEHGCSWIGLTRTNKRHWSLIPLGTDLHDGLPGMALFLAYLGATTREPRYIALAEAALATLRRQVERRESFITTVGGFVGWGGLIYALTHLSVLCARPALLSEAETMLDRLPALIERDEHFDIVAGAAGCIGSLIALDRCTLSGRALAVAVQCGDHLIARAQQVGSGIGWISKWAGTNPLTGFSHGGAGIAWALLELAVLSGEERFRTAAAAAIEYERDLFCPDAGNWPDLRDAEPLSGISKNDHSRFVTAWCYGAAGIGLARLRALQHLDDLKIRSEIQAALRTTLAHGFGGNHSLCHGDLGNLELLLQASETFEDPQWPHQVNRLTGIILDSISRNGWLCGSPLAVESPGLMTGLAGIGYGLLRLAEPQRVPSVLVLEPPVHHWKMREEAVPSGVALATGWKA